MLNELRNFDVERLSMEEMFYLSALGKNLRAEFQNRNMPPPEWLTDQLTKLEREILAKRRDELERRKKEIAGQLATLETHAEKRDRLQRERDELEKALTAV